WVCVRRSKCLPEGGNIQAVDFSRIVHRLKEALDFARKMDRLTWTEGARKQWHEVYPELSEGKPGLLGAVTSRSEAQVVRLAMLYALLDRSDHIGEQHLRAALALWEYCEHSARFIFGDKLGNPVADKILEALQNKFPGGMSRDDIRNDVF